MRIDEMTWQEILLSLQKEPQNTQLKYRNYIVSAVKCMLETGPTKEQYLEYMTGLTITPEILYEHVEQIHNMIDGIKQIEEKPTKKARKYGMPIR